MYVAPGPPRIPVEIAVPVGRLIPAQAGSSTTSTTVQPPRIPYPVPSGCPIRVTSDDMHLYVDPSKDWNACGLDKFTLARVRDAVSNPSNILQDGVMQSDVLKNASYEFTRAVYCSHKERKHIDMPVHDELRKLHARSSWPLYHWYRRWNC